MKEILAQYADYVGMTGVMLTLTGYFLLNVNKLASTNIIYLLLNCIGSTLVLYSLMFHWNLSSVAIEGAWITISLIGLYRVWRRRHQPRKTDIYLLRDVAKERKPG
jgi:hypothetical protein